jgi:hypothetical protein
MQHPNQIFSKTLETYASNMHDMQHPDLLFQYPDKTLET